MPQLGAHTALLLVLAAAAAATAPLAAAQTCGSIDALGGGRASGKGIQDDAPALQAMDRDAAIGLIYLPPGAYRIARSLSLRKPVFGEAGAYFIVESGATLTLESQPEYPLWAKLFELRGSGTVKFGFDTIRTYPEWFGAVANGVSDDSKAVQAAFNAASSSVAAMLYLAGKYGIGSELTFTPGTTIMAEPGARFVSVKGNARGVTFPAGGFAYKIVLPHLSGFSDFCVRLFGADLGSFQLQTLSGCGDAIRLEAQPGTDINAVLDNTIWFDTITDSRVGVAYRARTGCFDAECVYQGNQVLGNAINGCAASGATAAMGFYSAKPIPAWDSNQFQIGSITPCKSNTAYSMFHAEVESAREVLKVGSMGAVPKGAKLFTGTHTVLQASIHLREQQPEGAGALEGLATLVEFTGATTPPLGHAAIRAATKARSKASFNGGKSLLGNYFTIQAVPAADWLPGETQQFFVYHQMATGQLYQFKCNAPTIEATGQPIVACVQAQDNSQDEVSLTLINLMGETVKAGSTNIVFNLAVATLGSP